MATAGQWLEGARPRTLPAAIAPVATGTGLAIGAQAFHAGAAILSLAVAVLLQIGVNFANDYSDGIRGTDQVRVGPVRLVGQHLAEPGSVKAAAWSCFALAGLCGLGLILMTHNWWLIIVGAACIAAAWFYTGGKHPYGYRGLGEVCVFVFLGLGPVVGTIYGQALPVTWASVIAGIAVGALACAILVTNNLRDIPSDIDHGKRTLAVRLGDRATRALFAILIAIPALATIALAWVAGPTALIALISAPLAIAPLRIVLGRAQGRALIGALKATGLLALAFGILAGIGLALTSAT